MLSSFPLDFNSDLDQWEDMNDIDNCLSDTDENLIEVASDLVSDEDENSDNYSSCQSDDVNVDKATSDEFESDSDGDINFSSLGINDNQSTSINRYELLSTIFKLMRKIRTGIKFFRNHNEINEYVIKQIKLKNNEKNVGVLVLDLAIRWNSTYLLLDRLLFHKEILKNIFLFPSNFDGLTDQKKKTLHELTIKQNEYDLLYSLWQVLEPFMVATTVLSSQNYPSMAYSFLIWRFLSHFLYSTSSDEPLILALKESLRYQFNYYCNNKLPPWQLETMQVIFFSILFNHGIDSLQKPIIFLILH